MDPIECPISYMFTQVLSSLTRRSPVPVRTPSTKLAGYITIGSTRRTPQFEAPELREGGVIGCLKVDALEDDV